LELPGLLSLLLLLDACDAIALMVSDGAVAVVGPVFLFACGLLLKAFSSTGDSVFGGCCCCRML
jgi:hypothetical protein